MGRPVIPNTLRFISLPSVAFQHPKTQNARGLLVTDSGNYVTMLRLVPKESVLLPSASGSLSASAVAGTAGGSGALWGGGWGGGAGGASTGAGAGAGAGASQHQVPHFAVHEAWRVRADSAHTLAAASLDCYSPCATTAGGGAHGGSSGSGPHKVRREGDEGSMEGPQGYLQRASSNPCGRCCVVALSRRPAGKRAFLLHRHLHGPLR